MKTFRLFTLLSSLTLSLSSLGQHTAPAAQPPKNRCLLNLLSVLPLRDIQDLIVHYLDGYTDPEVIIPAHPFPTRSIGTTKFSSCGHLVSTGDSGVDLQIWKTGDRQYVKHQVLSVHDQNFMTRTCASAFSPDGKFLATAQFNGVAVSIWKLVNAKFISHDILRPGVVAFDIAFSPNGEYLIAGDLWKFDQKSEEFTLYAESLSDNANADRAVSFSPSGSHLVMASNAGTKVCKMYDTYIETEKILSPKIGNNLLLAFSPQEKYLVLAAGNALYRYKFNALQEDPEVLQMDDGSNNDVLINAISFSPNGKFLAIGFSGKPTEIWHVKTDVWSRAQVLENIQHSARTLAFSPDGLTLITGSQDGSLVRWRNQAAEILLDEKAVVNKK